MLTLGTLGSMVNLQNRYFDSEFYKNRDDYQSTIDFQRSRTRVDHQLSHEDRIRAYSFAQKADKLTGQMRQSGFVPYTLFGQYYQNLQQAEKHLIGLMSEDPSGKMSADFIREMIKHGNQELALDMLDLLRDTASPLFFLVADQLKQSSDLELLGQGNFLSQITLIEAHEYKNIEDRMGTNYAFDSQHFRGSRVNNTDAVLSQDFMRMFLAQQTISPGKSSEEIKDEIIEREMRKHYEARFGDMDILPTWLSRFRDEKKAMDQFIETFMRDSSVDGFSAGQNTKLQEFKDAYKGRSNTTDFAQYTLSERSRGMEVALNVKEDTSEDFLSFIEATLSDVGDEGDKKAIIQEMASYLTKPQISKILEGLPEDDDADEELRGILDAEIEKEDEDRVGKLSEIEEAKKDVDKLQTLSSELSPELLTKMLQGGLLFSNIQQRKDLIHVINQGLQSRDESVKKEAIKLLGQIKSQAESNELILEEQVDDFFKEVVDRFVFDEAIDEVQFNEKKYSELKVLIEAEKDVLDATLKTPSEALQRRVELILPTEAAGNKSVQPLYLDRLMFNRKDSVFGMKNDNAIDLVANLGQASSEGKRNAAIDLALDRIEKTYSTERHEPLTVMNYMVEYIQEKHDSDDSDAKSEAQHLAGKVSARVRTIIGNILQDDNDGVYSTFKGTEERPVDLYNMDTIAQLTEDVKDMPASENKVKLEALLQLVTQTQTLINISKGVDPSTSLNTEIRDAAQLNDELSLSHSALNLLKRSASDG